MSSETADSSAFEYDVVIVGGGTAGCVLANKLSARAPKLRFLLLEAGPNNNDDPRVRTPLKSRRMFENEDFDWCLKSVPQAGLNGREIQQTRGKMLGGSSAINSHSLVYPNREMHDAWAKLVGDKRWSWNSMAKYYQRFQEAGEDGERFVEASLPSKLNRIQKAWVQAFEELGYIASDPSDGKAIGGTTTTNAINSRGERSHSGNAFLEPAMGRANLAVKTISLVEKIALRRTDSDFCAEGVHYSSQGRRFFVKATKEVVLCAGVYGSPQLLELSGIGQRDVLQTANVDPVLDLAGVGGKSAASRLRDTDMIRKSSRPPELRSER
jgi:choline dehydrogenase-like flavoprotein